jgi:hypothetical protein
MSKFSFLAFGLLLISACSYPDVVIPKPKTEIGPCFRVRKSVCVEDKCRVDLKPIYYIIEQFPDNPVMKDRPRRVTLDFLAIRGDEVCKERDIYTNGQVFYRWFLLYEEQPL